MNVKRTLLRAFLYGVMIAFAAHVGEAIPYPYSRTIAALPVETQTFLFFLAGFLIYFCTVTLADFVRQRLRKKA
ncbi:hypothetical protein [Dysosmobacter sp.]|uniref:hypothetical protein n=1 Tax=Dysosmobacter sp. TaxID=2591382 RepID=UPI003AB43AD1